MTGSKYFAAAIAALLSATPALAFEIDLDMPQNTGLRSTVKGASATYEAQANDATEVDEILGAVKSDYRNILSALYREGHYGPTISIKVDGREASDLTLIRLPAQINTVHMIVDPGPQFRFRQAEIAPLAPDTDLPEEFVPGQEARSSVIKDAKDAAIDAWREASYAKADLDNQRIVADHPDQALDVALSIAPGRKATFGRLRFSGQTTVPDDRLQWIANLPTGKAYDPDVVELVGTRLRKTGTFRSVSIREAETLNPDGTLDIDVALVDDKRRRFGFGAEFSTVDGLTATAYWMHRNITDNADRLRFDFEVTDIAGNSGEDYSLTTTYRRPATVTPKTTLVLEAEIAHIDHPYFTIDAGQFTASAEVESSLISNFKFGIGYLYAQIDVFGTKERESYLLFPIEGDRDMRDNPLNPKEGVYFAAEITPFTGIENGVTGTRFYGDGRGYLSFGDNDRFTLAGRVQLGSVVGSEPEDTLPDFLFYSGGGGTVRGQPYDSLGIETASGTTGGTSFLGLSTELRAGITENISLVGFMDAGAVGATWLPGEDVEWHAGAGLGVRYNTTIGPIRLDLAGPVSGDTGDGIQLYIGVGQAF